MTSTAYHHLPTRFKVKWDRQFHLKCLLWWLSIFLASDLSLMPRKFAQHHRYNPTALGNQCLCLQVSTKERWESVERVLENVTGAILRCILHGCGESPYWNWASDAHGTNQLKHISALVFLPFLFYIHFPLLLLPENCFQNNLCTSKSLLKTQLSGKPNLRKSDWWNKAISRERERNVEW